MPNTTNGNPAPSDVTLIAGSDGTNVRTIKTDTGGAIQMDIESIIPGTAATNLGKAEDAVAASGDTGVAMLAVRSDTAVPNAAAGDYHWVQVDANGGLWATLATLIAGENATANRLMTMPSYTNSGALTGDTLVRTGACVVHSIAFGQGDAAPTAGSIDFYDNTAASGTKVYTHTFDTTTFRPTSILLDAACTTGLYVDFTTTADVTVFVTYLATA